MVSPISVLASDTSDLILQASKSGLIQCLLCECSTLEESLKTHIQYNHMIYKEQILTVLYDLHYPPLDQIVLTEMVERCEEERTNNASGKVKTCRPSPFKNSPGKKRTGKVRENNSDSPIHYWISVAG